MSLKDFDKKYSDDGLGFSRHINLPSAPKMLLDSGSFSFNLAHGIGGIKTGALMRLMGAPGLGKTSLACRIISSGLSKGMSCLYFDTEVGLNLDILKDSMEDAGLDPDDGNIPIRYVPATNRQEINKSTKPILTLERMLPMIEEFVIDKDTSPNGAIIVIDSLDFVTPEAVANSPVDQPTIAITARLMKNWLRNFMGTMVGTGSLIIVVSQVSSNITTGRTFETESFSGGNALKHASSLDIRLKDIGQVTEGAEKVLAGRKVKGLITKSKQGIPWRTFGYEIRHDTGPDRVGEVMDLALKLKIITGSAWLKFDEAYPNVQDYKFHGKPSLREAMLENMALRDTVEQMIMNEVSGGNAEVIEMVSAEERAEIEEMEGE